MKTAKVFEPVDPLKSEPFETEDEAEAAFDAFHERLIELAKELRIGGFLCAFGACVKEGPNVPVAWIGAGETVVLVHCARPNVAQTMRLEESLLNAEEKRTGKNYRRRRNHWGGMVN